MTGTELEAALVRLGWPKSHLAGLLGVHPNRISAWVKTGPPEYAAAYLRLAEAVKRGGLELSELVAPPAAERRRRR